MWRGINDIDFLRQLRRSPRIGQSRKVAQAVSRQILPDLAGELAINNRAKGTRQREARVADKMNDQSRNGVESTTSISCASSADHQEKDSG
jgi:hypothetical protein